MPNINSRMHWQLWNHRLLFLLKFSLLKNVDMLFVSYKNNKDNTRAIINVSTIAVIHIFLNICDWFQIYSNDRTARFLLSQFLRRALTEAATGGV